MLLNVTDRVVEIYTDGACIPNPGPGGWGALLRYGSHERELCGGESGITTNNRMELTAPIMALESLTRPSVVHVHTDSTYVKNGITQWVPKWKIAGWLTSAREPVKNEDLWKRLDAAASKHDVEWFWVKGHAGHAENERADELAERGLLEASPGAAVPTPRAATTGQNVQCGALTKSGKPCRAVTRGGPCQRHQIIETGLTLT